MAAPRPGPSSSSAAFLTGGVGGFEHLQQQQYHSGSGHGGHSASAGFASPMVSAAPPPGSSWFEQGGMLPPPAAAAYGGGGGGDGRGFGFGGYEVSNSSHGFNGCGGEAGGFAALSNAMSCGYGTAGLFSPMPFAGSQEGLAVWQGGGRGFMPAAVAGAAGKGKAGVRKREVEEAEEDLAVQVERGGGWGEEQEEEGGRCVFEESGSEYSRSSSEKGLRLLRRPRVKGGGGGAGGKKKKVKKAVAVAASSDSDDPLLQPDGGRKKRREMESPVPWTEDMVRFLFETYDDVHRRLWIESRGKVKNQKKWDPIIRTMQDKFGREFTKNQCESKYWKVRRECARFKSKRAMTEPDPSPGGSGGGSKPSGSRDVVKPKFYDVWLEVAGNDPVKMPEIELSSGSGEEDNGLLSPGAGLDEEDASPFDRDSLDAAAAAPASFGSKQQAAGGRNGGGGGGGGSTVREMQQFLSSHHEASEKLGEDLTIKAGVTFEAVRDHLNRMKRRGSMIDDASRAQLSVLQGVENKLDRLLNGLTALNGNIGAMVGRLATLPQR